MVRISRVSPDAATTAARELQVSRWLTDHGVRTVRAMEGLDQPVPVAGRTVTFWEELPPHRYGSYPQIAFALRRLHTLPPPTDFELPPLAPFIRLVQRIDEATTLKPDDRAWLRQRLAELEARYAEGVPPGLPVGVVHGDASAGNIVATDDGQVIVLDLERLSIGPPEWDLTAAAIDYTTFGELTAEGYRDFCRRYGADVMTWDGFELFRDMSEFRITCWMAQRAAEHPEAQAEAELRVACLRGRRGTRPWGWRAVL